jgi:thiamine biosynthesis lipoprotein ApbE
VRQVTITGPNGALADALATAVMVLGANEGLKLLAAYPAYGAIIIDNKNELYVTQNLKKRLYMERAPTP